MKDLLLPDRQLHLSCTPALAGFMENIVCLYLSFSPHERDNLKAEYSFVFSVKELNNN